MRHRLYYHIVWTTRNRLPLIDRARAAFLLELLGRVASQERASVLRSGLVSTHIHLLVRAHPSCHLPKLVQRWKSLSALLTRRHQIGEEERPLRWAGGYSIATVSESQLGMIGEYLDSQPRRHPHEAIVDGVTGDL
jgi:putative transposase